MRKPMIILAIAGLLAGLASTFPAAAQEERTTVIVQVDGLSCPFCAFGLEKKLRKLEGVKAVTIKPDRAVAEVVFHPGAVIDQDKIREAVVAGGFTPREIRMMKAETEPSIQ